MSAAFLAARQHLATIIKDPSLVGLIGAGPTGVDSSTLPIVFLTSVISCVRAQVQKLAGKVFNELQLSQAIPYVSCLTSGQQEQRRRRRRRRRRHGGGGGGSSSSATNV